MWKHNPSARVAVIGVGNELRGDDALGALIACALQPRLEDRQDVLVINAGSAPENFCGTLRRFGPDWVLILDAAHMGAKPGTVRWIDPDNTSDRTISTHALPMPVLLAYLEAELNCEVAILGIQPAGVGMGMPVSAPILQAIETITLKLAECLQTHDNGQKTRASQICPALRSFPKTEKREVLKIVILEEETA